MIYTEKARNKISILLKVISFLFLNENEKMRYEAIIMAEAILKNNILASMAPLKMEVSFMKIFVKSKHKEMVKIII
ncbi:MAG: hypothetical protein ABI550_08600 [Ignavibacteriaceae bacterium]